MPMPKVYEQNKKGEVADAKAVGANAIVDVRFSTSYVMGMAAEILVYGTAVVLEDTSD